MLWKKFKHQIEIIAALYADCFTKVGGNFRIFRPVDHTWWRKDNKVIHAPCTWHDDCQAVVASISTVTVHLHYVERSVIPMAVPICKVNIEKQRNNLQMSPMLIEMARQFLPVLEGLRSTEWRRKKNRLKTIRGNNFTISTYIPRSTGKKFANSALSVPCL